ncbi:MAG: hypothetical protein K2Q15_16220, partial [Burkholderiales bacterium]|nr:hypothetical protein [Burkholderiales bacterium]
MFNTQASYAENRSINISLCHEDEASYPWIIKGRPGLDLILLEMVGKKLNIVFRMQPLPWIRCLHDLKDSHVDGAFKLSFSTDRLSLGHYPMQGTKTSF